MKLTTFGLIVFILSAVGLFFCNSKLSGGTTIPYIYGSNQLYWIIAGVVGLLLAFAGRKSNKGLEREPKGKDRRAQKNI